MPTLRSMVLLVGVGAACGAGAIALRAHAASQPAHAAPVSTTALDIALYERRTAEDPLSAADFQRLAVLQLQRGRETGDLEHYRRAEAAARTSLGLRVDRNDRTMLVLASSLLAQHRFVEARDAARQLVERVAGDKLAPAARGLLAEIELELGNYPAADSLFTALQHLTEDLAIAPRLARWHEVHGRDDAAHAVLRTALTTARARHDLPAEQIAWFHLRLGDLALRRARWREASDVLKTGLAVNPDDARLLGALARLHAARGNWRRVSRYAERAGDRADIATLALAGDAAAALGDGTRAASHYAEIERRAVTAPEPFNRQWTEFRITHRRRLEETIDILRRELEIRPDVLGHALLARALCAAGRYHEAAAVQRPLPGAFVSCSR